MSPDFYELFEESSIIKIGAEGKIQMPFDIMRFATNNSEHNEPAYSYETTVCTNFLSSREYLNASIDFIACTCS